MTEERGFLSRWAQRKADVRRGGPLPAEPVVAPPPLPMAVPTALTEAPEAVAPPVEAPAAPPAPTLADVAELLPGDEVSRFVARGVDPDVQRAAVKKLFTDPHYNVMDGLDIYIDDYSKPDPIPMAMLRQLNQAKFMGLFAAEEAAEAAEAARLAQTAPTAVPTAVPESHPSLPPAQDADAAAPAVAAVPHPPDEDPDLQLQPDDAAGRPGAATRAGSDPG